MTISLVTLDMSVLNSGPIIINRESPGEEQNVWLWASTVYSQSQVIELACSRVLECTKRHLSRIPAEADEFTRECNTFTSRSPFYV